MAEALRTFRLRFVDVVATEEQFVGSEAPYTQTYPEIELAEGESVVAVSDHYRPTKMSFGQIVARVWIAA